MSGEGYEAALFRQARETHAAIGKVLRRVAGLPEEENPFIVVWPDEAGLPNLSRVAHNIIITSYGKAPIAKTPKAIEKNLKGIRRRLKYLRAQIAAIDSSTRSTINRAGSAEHAALECPPEDASVDTIVAASHAVENVPREQWTVPAALTSMERLENALFQVIEKAAQNSKSDLIPATGRPPDMAKFGVALIVGEFLKEATGDAPKLWPDDAPVEAWKRGESNEPFAVALTEIFKILGFKPGIQRAGEFARSKL